MEKDCPIDIPNIHSLALYNSTNVKSKIEQNPEYYGYSVKPHPIIPNRLVWKNKHFTSESAGVLAAECRDIVTHKAPVSKITFGKTKAINIGYDINKQTATVREFFDNIYDKTLEKQKVQNYVNKLLQI